MKELEIFLRARHLIENGWCQGWFSLDAENNECDVDSPKTVKFCAMGAMIRASKEVRVSEKIGDLMRIFSNYTNNEEIDYWNDHPDRTQAEVLAAFEYAINKIKEENGTT